MNVDQQAANLRADAAREQQIREAAEKLPESDREAFRELVTKLSETSKAAPETPQTDIPIPGRGLMPPAVNAHTMRSPRQQPHEYAGSQWDVYLNCHQIPGIAEKEVAEARKALVAFEEFYAENRRLLDDDWQSAAVEREARALAEYVDQGKEPPKSRQSEVEQAMRKRPYALAMARKLKADVARADAAAKEAFHREAPEALPRIRAEVAAVLDNAEAALAEVARAAAEANKMNASLNTVRKAVEKPLPLEFEMWTYTLFDVSTDIRSVKERLQSARRRIGPVTKTTEAEHAGVQ